MTVKILTGNWVASTLRLYLREFLQGPVELIIQLIPFPMCKDFFEKCMKIQSPFCTLSLLFIAFQTLTHFA